MKVFLGGTCNNSLWREFLIPKLEIDYFNPVVGNWTTECQEEELLQRQECDFVLYTITPLMSGVYSIAEVVDDSNKRPEKTLLHIASHDIMSSFTDFQRKSLQAVADLVASNGGRVFDSLDDVAEFLNRRKHGRGQTTTNLWID